MTETEMEDDCGLVWRFDARDGRFAVRRVTADTWRPVNFPYLDATPTARRREIWAALRPPALVLP